MANPQGQSFEWVANNNNNKNVPHNPGKGLLLDAEDLRVVVPPRDAAATATTAITFDGGVRSGKGDDTSPPNAASQVNGIAVPVSSSAGWSTHAPRNTIYPTNISYHVNLLTTNGGDDNLEMGVILEYDNPFHADLNESMVVRAAVAITCLYEKEELALVSTKFQEQVVNEQWVDITADVDYTQVADNVVEAVMNSNTDQTVGKATISAETVDVTLGPFSKRARILLTYKAESVYTYQAMLADNNNNNSASRLIGSHRLCPIIVALPFALPDHESGLTRLSVTLTAPAGTGLLQLDPAKDAYVHLKQQHPETCLLAVTKLEAMDQQNNCMGYTNQWGSLPPRACGLLAWLALPNDNDDDFVQVDLNRLKLDDDDQQQQQQIRAVVQVPSQQDAASLQVPLPGHGPMGKLYRIKLTTPKARRPRTTPRLILNLTLSDKSGSTARTYGGSGAAASSSMRQRFNELAILRFLKRLESIPALVQNRVLLMDDVWMDAFVAFDHKASNVIRVSFYVRDVVNNIASDVAAIRSNNNTASSFSSSSSSTHFAAIKAHVDAIHNIAPGGGTDFAAGPRHIASEYRSLKAEAMSQLPKDAEVCSFLEFDTDGGHYNNNNNNSRGGQSDYLDEIRRLCDSCQVRNGVVTGFGSWLNQDCASRVAETIGTVPAQLAMQIPEAGSEGLDLIFRRSFSAWLNALRQPPPFDVKLAAGSISFQSSATSTRNANGMEVLAVRRHGTDKLERLPKFGPPDVSNETYTATVLTGVPAAEELMLYVVSRHETVSKFVEMLGITSSTCTRAIVTTDAEKSVGDFISYDWLKMLTSKQAGMSRFSLAPLLSTNLRSRMEDEISFRFNMASPSGATSFLGRCKTIANRAAIDAAHQPNPPPAPFKKTIQSMPADGGLLAPSGAPTCPNIRFGGCALAPSVSPFGAPAPSPSPFGTPSSVVPRNSRFGAPASSATSSFGGAAGTSVSFPHSSGAFGSAAAVAAAAPAPAPFVFGRSSGSGAPASSASSRFSSQAAPAPRRFRSSSFSRTPSGAPSHKEDWSYAMTVPCGFDSPKQLHVKDLITALHLTCRRLVGDPTVVYFCDLCAGGAGRNLNPGEDRFHCLDCDDFDVCGLCRDRHDIPFHRIAKVTGPASFTSAPADDPLLSTLLKPPATTGSSTALAAPADDRTMTLSKRRIERFLLSILHWWPLFRSMCWSYEELPEAIPDDLSAEISSSRNTSNNEELVNTIKIITDSIMRVEK